MRCFRTSGTAQLVRDTPNEVVTRASGRAPGLLVVADSYDPGWRAYVDGSFISAKELPGDFDGCWEVDGVDLTLLDPVLMTFAQRRAAQKQKYGGELFPADWAADAHGTSFLLFFQRDRASNRAKGIIAIDLGDLP